MMPKIKNIIIFVGIAIALILIYIYFIKGDDSDEVNLVASGTNPTSLDTTSGQAPQITQEFLTILLNIKNIRLDDSIFSDSAFLALHDSSIIITPDGNEGRPNPFAPIGFDSFSPPPTQTAPVNPPNSPTLPGAPAGSPTTPASGASTSGATTTTTTTTTPPGAGGSGAGATAN